MKTPCSSQYQYPLLNKEAGAALLLGSAITGPGFDTRGSRDAAILDIFFRQLKMSIILVRCPKKIKTQKKI
jgi:hypothetical protein